MRFLLFVCLILTGYLGVAQSERNLRFLEHLINRGYYEEVIFSIDHDTTQYSILQTDSLQYYRGWAHYSLKNLEQSTQSFMNVGVHSPFHLKSQFFASYNQLFLGNYAQAQSILNNIHVTDDPFRSLIHLEMSGIELLQENTDRSNELLKQTTPDLAIISQQVTALTQIINERGTHRPKSPLLAGVMSAIIPGTGKLYARKTGEGISSMLATIGFGVITWENYHKLGLTNIKTLFFGSIFTATYVSNIYGSVVSVKLIENEYQNAIHNQILFQLHIPLRNIFEQ